MDDGYNPLWEDGMRDLKGKVVVVTGAASGIGKAMAERFGREGMKLVLADVEERALMAVREAFTKQGVESIAMTVDVSKADQVEGLAKRAFEKFGAVHVLCNNAGIAAGGFTWELSQADWEWVLGVNMWGVIHGIRAFVPRMITQEEGHVVNTASVAGLIAAPGMAGYCASKHAVVAISECLHHDLNLAAGGKVKVSVLCPGWVRTRIADSERNRPTSMPRRPATSAPQAVLLENMVRQAVAGGIAPEEVAEQVHQAVLDERFWILTHPNSRRMVEKRMTGIMEDQNPVFDPSKMA
jgi:NAD(P)-dependent dehydrogenase (short-subunit alcohol dehydrogenase family)